MSLRHLIEGKFKVLGKACNALVLWEGYIRSHSNRHSWRQFTDRVLRYNEIVETVSPVHCVEMGGVERIQVCTPMQNATSNP